MTRLALTTRARRRLLIAGSIVGGVAILVVIGLLVVYPRVGAWMVRSKVVPKLEAKLGRAVSIAGIDVSLGHATLRDIVIRGPNDGTAPMVRIAKVEVEFATLPSLVGTAKIEDVIADGVAVSLRRGEQSDNFTDLIVKLGLRKPADGSAPPKSASFGSMRPAHARARGIKVNLVDDVQGTQVTIGDGDAELARDKTLKARLAQIVVSATAGPGAAVGSLAMERAQGVGAPTITVIDGELRVWPKLALTGISGTIAPNGDPGRYDVDLAGGYGGVAGTLWTAQGWIDPAESAGAIDATADQFTFNRLAPILEKSPVKDFDNTAIDGKLHLDIGRDQIGFAGSFHLAGLNIFDLRLADDEVKDIELVGDLAGTYTRATRMVKLDKGAFESRGLPFEVTGWWALPGGDMGGGMRRERHALDAIWTIPPVDCQKALAAIPTELAPMMAGYRLSGTFRSRIHVGIDWANLQATTLVDDSSVRIRDCKVKDRPDDSPLRLRDQFEHFVELDQDEWISFIVGPDNNDFVPLSQVSPYLLKSLMTTEDSNFYNHHGFIVKEFQSALIKNLEAGRFKYGASSITMQLVKNVLLYRKKTLSRKLQELFLTWDIENVLDKDRIFEIYVNVIEYGPGLYGIGPAARQYFGKHPRDLNIVEAAFFSSILPHPKDSYKQYCEGTLTRITSAKIERILDRMHERKRITDEEYADAQATPLLFSKDGTESDKDCLDRTIRAIKRQRSTNPLAKDKSEKPDKPKKKDR